MKQIDFTDYDRIVDIIFYFTQNISMSFNVVMSRKNQINNHRMFFQYETEYSSKYSDTNIGRSIKRNINYYYTIDNKNDFANGFILRPQDVELICMVIDQQILPWFIGSKRIFSITKDKSKLIIKGEFSPVIYAQSEYKYLKFVPIVLTFEDGTYKEGIRMYLNSESEFADMDLDKFLGLYHILRTTDMYAVACSMLNYAKMPPYGVNTFRMSGLGGGYVNDNWNESEDVSDSGNKTRENKGNNFLDKAKENKEELEMKFYIFTSNKSAEIKTSARKAFFSSDNFEECYSKFHNIAKENRYDYIYLVADFESSRKKWTSTLDNNEEDMPFFIVCQYDSKSIYGGKTDTRKDNTCVFRKGFAHEFADNLSAIREFLWCYNNHVRASFEICYKIDNREYHRNIADTVSIIRSETYTGCKLRGIKISNFEWKSVSLKEHRLQMYKIEDVKERVAN